MGNCPGDDNGGDVWVSRGGDGRSIYPSVSLELTHHPHSYATAFNGDLSGWDTSAVETMEQMFK